VLIRRQCRTPLSANRGRCHTLHQLTRFPVLIQDVHGNTRAAAGDVPGHRRAKEQLDYDKRHRSDLLATLAQYFDSGCNIDQAAAVLSIHRSTLKYRLKRVRELLGQDLNDGSTRLDLHLATRVWLTLESLRRTEQA
jgi:DNA-binding PucR family transcriptional regulator